MLFGSGPYVLLLQSGTNAGPVNRNVTIIHFTSAAPIEKPIILTLAADQLVPEPKVQSSPGNGAAFLISSGPGAIGLLQFISIRKSDGSDDFLESLCSIIEATPGTLSAEATA